MVDHIWSIRPYVVDHCGTGPQNVERPHVVDHRGRQKIQKDLKKIDHYWSIVEHASSDNITEHACVWRRRPDHMLNEIPIPFFEIWILGAQCMLSPEFPSTLQHAGQCKETMAEFHIQLSRSNSSHTVLTKCLNCLNQNLDAEIIFKSFFCNKSDQFVFFFFGSEVCAWNRQQKLTQDSKIIF